MEGIERIKEKIMQEAREKEQQILNEARAEADQILKNSEQTAEEIKQQSLQKAKRQAEEEKRKILSMAELEERKGLLQAKQQIIDEVFDKARQELANLPVEDYRQLIYKMLLESSITGDEEIIIDEKDKSRITPDLVEKVNKELKTKGKSGNLKISAKTRPMIGGFILKARDMEINSTFDSLIKLQREELETGIAKILFEE
ncbi:MAG: V/A-type H+/Na+-transporting ATPase subunit [Thermoanaerobacteraceae bacterium]|jgi:V/A-type H+-transporting ATPase subunit E|uniref:V-type proton ATPase subunit E n=1 Tax=Biomaibacter acetigenes TaxID=2316383 RepID=A0A3G2R8L5_9FIRM|nr:V-type ATP synthase subunit E family protein [Biomaibacter acetigenes]MDK2879711.1 V/A-type H+/Na+-transporting ATPase subunit [Thermoanaerobacteraceae bacterium]RKL62482.1 V-type ATP synthase subunit E [Thermoanaerobacteraceae bacterium SP2]AYO31801.1 V-type ATP synthase subunit E [Biomaibacter acetigenes]MDN5302449.1 V/A-type H+/Na+-transporting ATPase subunit [Thermoanaerobacteraceae bacterium]MDN5312900.1 V/A-type H+/Na+-transporting ATPase subunit [Thermoanaerobacteraceae bacterium]